MFAKMATPVRKDGPDVSDELRILVLTDCHHQAGSVYDPAVTLRRTDLGCEIVRKAIEDAKAKGGFDAIFLLGDLLNNGTRDIAKQELAEIRAQIEEALGDLKVPILVVPGNHDGDAGRLFDIFDSSAGLHEIGGYRFVVFADPYAEGDFCTRTQADRDLLQTIASQDGGPIIALQHNPIDPAITKYDYPFMHTNRDAIMEDYRRAGVMLSISGHFHLGQDLHTTNGVQYLTIESLTDPPFCYGVVTLRGTEVSTERRVLHVPGNTRVVDTHAHSEFAYCASDTFAEGATMRARALGLSGICIVEHSGQLYLSSQDFWAANHVFKPGCLRDNPDSRMAEFRRKMEPMRSDFVRIGMEVEVAVDGSMTLLDEDREWIDLIVGAVHWLVDGKTDRTDAETIAAFMKSTEMVLACDVDILAHPWRFFVRKKQRTPSELYATLAQMLADTNTAAEINFHTNSPGPAFFAECIERGVKISLGSDGHALWEAGLFSRHLNVLYQAAGTTDINDLLLF